MEKNVKLAVVEVPAKDGNSVKKQSFWLIDKKMLPFKMHFFLFIGGMGAVLPYQSALGITKLGFTASNLAAAYTTQQFLFIFTKPGIGYLADYFNKLKAIIVGLTVLQAVFCLLMIFIPSADMPKNYVSHSNASLNKYYNCHICTHFEELKNISSKQSLAEDILQEVLNCFNYSAYYESGYIVEHCPNENLNSSYSSNISYRINQIKCDDSLKDLSSSLIHTARSSQYSTNALFISQFFDSSLNSLVICFPPKGLNFLQENISYSLKKQYCYSVLKPESINFDYHLLATPFYTNCINYKSNISASVQYEYNADLSASNFKTYQFWLFSLCLIVSCASISSIFTISDTACYESMQGADYGRQRAWGAVSWGVIAPFAGFLNDYTDSYMASWCLMVVLCSLQIWNMSKMNLVKPDFSQNILKDIKTIFSSFEFLAFEIGVFMNGLFTGIIWFYLTWFLTTIGGNKLVIGFAHTIQCFLGEVPFLFVSTWFIKKIGHFNIVSLALIAHGIRFFIYSYLYNPWWILPIEMLHGFTFGTFYSAMTSYGKLNSKPGTEATTQSVLCTTYEALGAGMGCVIFGVCFDYYGAHTTFFYSSFLCVAATLINVVFTVLIRCRKGGLDVTKTTAAFKGRY